MRKWITLTTLVISLFALSIGAMAASPGDVLPPGASEVEVFEWDGSNWVGQGTGSDSAPARSWNSTPVNSGGYQNNEHHNISFTSHASVAQWIDWTLSGTRKDWRVRRPGTYASDSLSFTIKSNNDVAVTFSEFDDMEYEDLALAPQGTQTHIPTWYSFGDTIADAEANGWVSALDLNETDLTFVNTNPLHYGLSYKLWSKILVQESNNSSDYENVGQITLSLTNMKHWIDNETGKFTADQTQG